MVWTATSMAREITRSLVAERSMQATTFLKSRSCQSRSTSTSQWAVRTQREAHNRLWLSVAHSMGHGLETFGNAEFCQGGGLGVG